MRATATAPADTGTTMEQITTEAFILACRAVAAHGLVRCSSGNLSWRIDDECMLVTSSRSWMEKITAAQATLCRIEDGAPLDNGRPTVEVGFHAGILRTRPDVNIVLHYQTPFATTVACRGPANTFVIPEVPFYVGPVAHVPYLPPGSTELAEAVTDAGRDHDMIVLQNHGQVALSADVDHAIQNAVFFELACEIIVRGGDSVRPLSEEAINQLLAARRSAGETP